jgi:hypothetical protein
MEMVFSFFARPSTLSKTSPMPPRSAAVSFVQILEYETDQPAEVAALAGGRMGAAAAAAGSLPPGFRVLVTQDRDNARHFVTIVEFPSEAAANQAIAENNSAEVLEKMTSLCTSGPKFTYLNVATTLG